MITHSLSPQSLEGYYLQQMRPPKGYPDQHLPDVLVLDVADLVKDFQTEWDITLRNNATNNSCGKPNITRVLKQVLEAIQQENDAELELAAMAYNDIASLIKVNFNNDDTVELEKYSMLHIELANATVRFGKEIIKRFRKEAVYHHGYFPYKFKCLVGSTIAVQLVEKLVNSIPDPECEIRKGDTFNVCQFSTTGLSDIGSDQYV